MSIVDTGTFQKAILIGLLTFGPGVFASEPKPFVAIADEWGQPIYEPPAGERTEEKWTYNRKHSTLILIRNSCSICEPASQKLIDLYNKHEVNTVAMLVDFSGMPAALSFSKTLSDYHVVSALIVVPNFSYRLQLVISDKAPASTGFALQQELFRMAQATTSK